MSYLVEHEKWLNGHRSKRSGRRLDALQRGHGYGNQKFAERIWWRLFGHFKGLHPEYEVLDWRGQPFYADFMWIIGVFRIVFEIQDFGSHVEKIDRKGYARELNREMFMQSMQYIVVNISLDELKNNPELILTLVRTIIMPYLNQSDRSERLPLFNKIERDLMFFAYRNNRILHPVNAVKELEISLPTVRKYMMQLVHKEKFRAIPAGISNRITSYEYIGTIIDLSD
jgi:hypothetical protein